MSVQERRRKKIQRILEAALAVWAEEDFQKTSLSSLADHLGMTKQALYRYFKNKEDLISQLNRYIRERYTIENRRLLEGLRSFPEAERMGFFVKNLAEFNLNNPDFLKFENFWIIKTGDLQLRITQEEKDRLKELLGLSDRELSLISIYALFAWGWQKRRFSPEKSSRRKQAILLELISCGLGTPHFTLPREPLRIDTREDYKRFRKRMEQENLLLAISRAIQEQGFRGVTLENIAEKAGLSKSTLYNYFRNKDEMLTKAINQVLREYMAFHAELLSQFDTFEEKLLAHLELQSQAFPIKPQSLILLRQFMERHVLQEIEPPVNNPDFLRFIQDGIDQKKLKPLLHAKEYQMIFSSFIFIEKVIPIDKNRDDEAFPLIGWLRLLAEGIRKEKRIEQGEHNEETSYRRAVDQPYIRRHSGRAIPHSR